MKNLTQKEIDKIEKIFGFSLYDWQKSELLGECGCKIPKERGTGRTFSYCLWLLLQADFPIFFKDLHEHSDEESYSYKRWFSRYCEEINKKLVEAGFNTNLMYSLKDYYFEVERRRKERNMSIGEIYWMWGIRHK